MRHGACTGGVHSERTCRFKVRVGGSDSAWELAIAARGIVIPASRAFSASRIARSDGTCASNGKRRIHIPAIVPSPYPLWHTAKWGVSPFQSPTKGIEEAYGKATRLPTQLQLPHRLKRSIPLVAATPDSTEDYRHTDKSGGPSASTPPPSPTPEVLPRNGVCPHFNLPQKG